jgi:Jacalin-like lectin domain
VTSFNFGSNEQIAGVSGLASDVIYSLTFKTSLGKTYGPTGGNAGTAFTFTGPVFGFFGTIANGCVAGLGFWTLATSIPPPPLSPPPPVPPPPPLARQPPPPLRPRPPPPRLPASVLACQGGEQVDCSNCNSLCFDVTCPGSAAPNCKYQGPCCADPNLPGACRAPVSPRKNVWYRM